MIYPSADKLENWGSKYSLVVLAARRAKQLKSGAPPLIDTDSRNPLTIALEEIASGVIFCQVPDNDIPVKAAEEPEVAQLLAIPTEPLGEEEEVAAEASETLAVDEDLSQEEEEDEEEEEEEDLVRHDDYEEDEEEEEEAPFVDDEDAEIAPDVEEEDLTVIPPAEEEKPKARRGRKPKAAEPVIDIDVDEPLDLDAEGEDSEEDPYEE